MKAILQYGPEDGAVIQVPPGMDRYYIQCRYGTASLLDVQAAQSAVSRPLSRKHVYEFIGMSLEEEALIFRYKGIQ